MFYFHYGTSPGNTNKGQLTGEGAEATGASLGGKSSRRVFPFSAAPDLLARLRFSSSPGLQRLICRSTRPSEPISHPSPRECDSHQKKKQPHEKAETSTRWVQITAPRRQDLSPLPLQQIHVNTSYENKWSLSWVW